LHVAAAEYHPAAADLFIETVRLDVGVPDELNLQRLEVEGLTAGGVLLDQDS
jgi:hypothetical protein